MILRNAAHSVADQCTCFVALSLPLAENLVFAVVQLYTGANAGKCGQMQATEGKCVHVRANGGIMLTSRRRWLWCRRWLVLYWLAAAEKRSHALITTMRRAAGHTSARWAEVEG